MKETIIETKKIVALGEEFADYEIENLVPLNFDLFVYKYERGDYAGSGFAVGKKGDTYWYHELGHCSCNGPTDMIDRSAKAVYSFDEVKKIAEKSYGDYSKEVISYLEGHEK